MENDLKRVGLVFTQEGAVDFKKTLQEVNLELNKNYNQFKLTQAQWNKSTKSTEKLKAEQEYLKNAYQIQTDKVKTLKMQLSDLENAENKNTTAIKKKRNELTNAEIKLETYNKRLKEIEGQLSNTGKKVEEFGTKIKNVGNKIENTGKKVTAFSVATGTALLTSAKSAIDFEDAFTGVEKTVDGTEQQMAELQQGIRNMAKEIPSTTTEISAVAEAAGQLGIQTDNILSFTKTMINMGNATNLSADEAATTLARFANVTKMKQTDFDKLGSVIVALGNNFATTESEITAMGMNLASAGTQVGMSQAQIMALATALSSVGLEAQAGGTAFSKVMVNMQLAVEKGGKELKDFAKVAGMSSKEFSTTFKKDATTAIMKFVEGLSKSGERGKSAIKVLDDMGITETRLRDSLLRSANASSIFSGAIEIGTKAWEENTALTNEANKRYGTLKSQIQIVTNRLKDIGITIGNKLMPYFSKLVKGIESVTKWFDSLNDSQVETIMNIGLAVTAIGPLLTLFGKATSVVGTTTKGFGKFIQILGITSKNTGSTSGAISGLSKVIEAIKSPVGIATVALSGLAAAVVYFSTRQTEAQKQVKELAENIDNAGKELDSFNKKIDDNASAELSQISHVQKLKEELDSLVGQNNEVKKSDEGRANFIVNQLNKALGTEMELTNGQIKNYKNLQEEINNVIEKKKAEITITAEEEKYKNAIENQAKAVQNLKETQEKLGMTYEQAKDKATEYYTKMQEGKLTFEDLQGSNLGLIASFVEADEQVKTYTGEIKQYQEDYAKFTEGKYNEIGQNIKETTKDWTDNTLQEISNSIKEQKQSLDYYKQIYDATGNEVAKQSYEQAQKNLSNLTDELYTRTSTIGELSKNEIEAWATLALNDYEAFKQKIEPLNDTVKQKLNTVAEVVRKDKSISNNMGELAQAAEDAFKSKDSNKWGADMIEGMARGIKSKTHTSLKSAVSGAASLITSWLHFSRPDVGPLREYEKWMPDMVEGLSTTLEKSSPKLEKTVEQMTEHMSNELQNLNFQPNKNNLNNVVSEKVKLDIDYLKLTNSIVMALNKCKFTLDEDGFAKIVKNELYEVL